MLRDRRAALRKDRRAARVSGRHLRHPCTDSHFSYHAGDAEVVDAVMREEALVFRSKDRVTYDRWDVLVPRDLPVLPGELDERLAVGVIDTADSGELKAGERPQVGQVPSIKVDLERTNREQPSAR